MHSLLSRVSLGAAVLLALVLRWTDADAQSAPTPPTTSAANRQEEASKLTDEAIAAQDAKDYVKSIALYKQAYQLVPHPILQFNIGQVYWLAGDLAQAEKFYKRYLERDPDGPGAPTARQFLSSLPASPPRSSGTAPSPRQTASPTSAGASVLLSSATRTPGPATTVANEGRITMSAASEHHPEQIEPSPGRLANEIRPQTPTTIMRSQHLLRAQDEQLKSAKRIKHAGYSFMVVSAALAAAALSYDILNDSDLVLGTTFGVVMVTFFGGAGIVAYGEDRLRIARRVAWSPVIGVGFTGIAWSGTLP